MKAIETHYRGYRFRSRLEARWAVFFDALGIAWEYEPEGFEMEDGFRYLPDFKCRLPKYAGWYEIKPLMAYSDAKLTMFQKALCDSEALATLLSGEPWEMLYKSPTVYACPICGFIDAHDKSHEGSEKFQLSMLCTACDCSGLCSGVMQARNGLICNVVTHKGAIFVENARDYNEPIMKACDTARAARFEFGECG